MECLTRNLYTLAPMYLAYEHGEITPLLRHGQLRTCEMDNHELICQAWLPFLIS